MAFSDNLKRLPAVDGIEKLELYGPDGRLAAVLENKPGKAGSLAVYNHLLLRHGRIDSAVAREGLELFAEHTADARANPGKHPNIDRLFELVESGQSLTGKVIPR